MKDNADFNVLNETEVESRIRESVKRISESLGPDYADRCIAEGLPPRELWEELSQGGFIGAGISSEYDGGGLGLRGLFCVAEELARTGNPLVLLVMTSGIVAPILEEWGTEDQKAEFLPAIASGRSKFAFAITEEEAGSNMHNIKTALGKSGSGGFCLNGSKCFISGVDDADYILVVSRLKQDDGALGAPALAVVDADDPGIQKNVIAMPNFSADKQWQVFFDDVAVPENRIVGGLRHGAAAVFSGLNPERILMAAYCNGTAMKALDLATDYAKERNVWGNPIGAHQAVSHPIAKAKIDLELARLMGRKAAFLYDSSRNDSSKGVGEYANYAKYASAESAVKAVDTAIQVHGGNGFTDAYGVAKLYWPARLFRTAPVSDEMILNHVAQNVLGLPRSY